MTPPSPPPSTVDQYIASSPAEVRPILERIRLTVKKAAPLAEERVSYRIPAYFPGGVAIYFAAFKKHLGVFPPVRDESLRSQLLKYMGPKGNLMDAKVTIS